MGTCRVQLQAVVFCFSCLQGPQFSRPVGVVVIPSLLSALALHELSLATCFCGKARMGAPRLAVSVVQTSVALALYCSCPGVPASSVRLDRAARLPQCVACAHELPGRVLR